MGLDFEGEKRFIHAEIDDSSHAGRLNVVSNGRMTS